MPPPGLGFPGSRPRLPRTVTTECRGLQEEAKPPKPSLARLGATPRGCLSLDPYQRLQVRVCIPPRLPPRWGQAGLPPHGDWVPGGSSDSPQKAILGRNQQPPPADSDCVAEVAERLRGHEYVCLALGSPTQGAFRLAAKRGELLPDSVCCFGSHLPLRCTLGAGLAPRRARVSSPGGAPAAGRGGTPESRYSCSSTSAGLSPSPVMSVPVVSPCLARMVASSSLATSAFCTKKSLAFSRPCPRRVSP